MSQKQEGKGGSQHYRINTEQSSDEHFGGPTLIANEQADGALLQGREIRYSELFSDRFLPQNSPRSKSHSCIFSPRRKKGRL